MARRGENIYKRKDEKDRIEKERLQKLGESK